MHKATLIICSTAHNNDVIRVSGTVTNYVSCYFTLYPILGRLFWQEIHSFSSSNCFNFDIFIWGKVNSNIKTL